MTDPKKFIVGANYWPAEQALELWKSFDPRKVEAEMKRAADAGLEWVRVFLRWEDFQPEPSRPSAEAFDNLVSLADSAAAAGLRIAPTFFTGFMCGILWFPPWMLESSLRRDGPLVYSSGALRRNSIRNWYGERDLIKAQVEHARQVAGLLKGSGVVAAWDLGHMPSLAVVPPSTEATRYWLLSLAEALRDVDASVPVTLGLAKSDLVDGGPLGPLEAAEVCDFISVEAFPFGVSWLEETDDVAWPAFVGALAGWLTGKPVLVHAFGNHTEPGSRAELSKGDRALLEGTSPMDEDDAAVYCLDSIEQMRRAGLMGALVWCLSDFAAATWDRPPLDRNVFDRFFGLYRDDGSPKAAALALSDLGKLERIDPDPDPPWIDIDAEGYWADPSAAFERLFWAYRDRL